MGAFLKLCNKPTERSLMISTLIHSQLVNAASHLVSVQSSKLIMTLEEKYVPKESIAKSITGDIVLDL